MQSTTLAILKCKFGAQTGLKLKFTDAVPIPTLGFWIPTKERESKANINEDVEILRKNPHELSAKIETERIKENSVNDIQS